MWVFCVIVSITVICLTTSSFLSNSRHTPNNCKSLSDNICSGFSMQFPNHEGNDWPHKNFRNFYAGIARNECKLKIQDRLNLSIFLMKFGIFWNYPWKGAAVVLLRQNLLSQLFSDLTFFIVQRAQWPFVMKIWMAIIRHEFVCEREQ